MRRWGIVLIIDFADPGANDWLAANQFTVSEGRGTACRAPARRPDIVLFVNGLPLAVIELKNAADEDATIWTAFHRIQTYKAELPTLFALNELLVISDGLEARVGTLTAAREWFKPWRTITGADFYPPPLPSPRPDGHPSPIGRGDGGEGFRPLPELQVVIEGVFAPRRFLGLLRDFIVLEDDLSARQAGGGRIVKKMAGYHQFHAVQVAVRETLRGGCSGRR